MGQPLIDCKHFSFSSATADLRQIYCDQTKFGIFQKVGQSLNVAKPPQKQGFELKFWIKKMRDTGWTKKWEIQGGPKNYT